MKLYTIGTVIQVEQVPMIILGYDLLEKEDTYLFCYTVGLFPIGMIPGQEDSVAFLPVHKPFTVLSEGYCDEVAKALLKVIQERMETITQVKPSEGCSLLEQIKQKMEEML